MIKKLNKLYYIKLEIKELEEEINSLNNITSSILTGMPHGTTISNPVENTVLKKQKLLDKLSNKQKKYIEELVRVEDIIDNIEDIEVRLIARMRFIDNKRWDKIGKLMNLDRTACYRKLKKYFNEVKNG